jgi:hypothetical protein
MVIRGTDGVEVKRGRIHRHHRWDPGHQAVREERGHLGMKKQPVERLGAQRGPHASSRLQTGAERPVAADERGPGPGLAHVERDENPRRHDLGIPGDPLLKVLCVGDLAQGLLHHKAEPIGHRACSRVQTPGEITAIVDDDPEG